MGIQITGLEQVQRRLKEAPKTLVLKAYARALDRASGVIAAALEANAESLPESGSNTRLAEHVITKVEVDTNGKGGVAVVGFDSTLDERTGIPQDLKAFLNEYGHRMVTHKPGLRDVGEVPMHPMVRPAFEASADKAIEVFGEVLIENLSVIEETK